MVTAVVYNYPHSIRLFFLKLAVQRARSDATRLLSLRKVDSMQSTPARRPLIAVLILVLSFLAMPVAAQEGQPPAVNIFAEAGFDGFYKGEFWVPVYVTVANGGPAIAGQIQITIESRSFDNDVVYSSPVSLPTQSNKRLVLYVHLPNIRNRLTVELVDERGRLIAEATTNSLDLLAVDELLYGVVRPGAGSLAELDSIAGDRPDAAVAFLDIAGLPEAAAAWNALDIVVFQDIDTADLSTDQLAALRGWLDTGGQLVVTGGPGWQKTTAGLADLLPVTVSGSRSIDDLPALAEYAGVPFRDPGPYLVATNSLRDGEVLIHQDGLPLLARHPVGRGQVYFLALDPDLAPLVDWRGGATLWQEIALGATLLPAWALGAQNSYAAYNSVSSLPSLALPSAALLFVFLIFYVIIVGPVNYLVLKRMGRRELAWATVPGLVIIFSVLAYLAGFRLRGNDIILNEMAIAYGQVGADHVRVQSLIGLYSPNRATYDLALPVEAVGRPFQRGSSGISGGGNMASVERNNSVTMRQVRVDVSAVEAFVADSYQPAPEISGRASLAVVADEFTLEISIQNNSPMLLQNATVMLGFTALALGDILPGEIVTDSYRLSAAQAGSVTGGSLFAPGATTGSPLAANYDILLGTVNFYDDRVSHARWQLLEAITPQYGTSFGHFPHDVVTLVFWSGEMQLPAVVDGQEDKGDHFGTTLYFLELPLSQALAGGRDVVLPQGLLSWTTLDEGNVYYNPGPHDLYLPANGWVEFEFSPWADFRGLKVTELSIVLQEASSGYSQASPSLYLWDWQAEDWLQMDGASWGGNIVAHESPYIGPGNAVRIRIENDNAQAIQIRELYPSLKGDL
jgi:hypothetical protein